METHYTIQQVVERTGLTAHTLRYYERIGLICDIARDVGGRRRFTAADMVWLEFLMRLRGTGMPIAAMLHYAELRRQGEVTHAERAAMMEAHLHAVEQQIARLQELAVFVADKVRWYRNTARISITEISTENDHAESESGKPALHGRTRKTQGN
jgi:DNA-binding transcriptional MerR regulator